MENNTINYNDLQPDDLLNEGSPGENEQNAAENQTPLLPVKGFPMAIREIINTCAETYGTPRDYWAGAVLTGTALAIGNKLELVNNYRNVPVLWLVLLGNVSSGKSNPLDFCLDYFKRLDSRSIKKYQEEIDEYNRISAMPQKDRLKTGFNDKPAKPECFQLILNDFTPEAMVEAHRANNRGMLILRDELKGWIDDFGRYSKSGEQSNMISSWSGIGITYNRKTSGILNIERPCIMVCGGMQPELLPTLAADNRAENGFLSRLCMVYPDNAQKTEYNNNILPAKIKTYWEEFLAELINQNSTLELTLSPGAEAGYSEWYNRNVKITNEEPSGYLKGVYGKLDIISLRLSLIIRGMKMVCEGDYSKEVEEGDMKAALALTEYFRATALKVYRKLFGDESDINKKLMANYLYRHGMTKFDLARYLRTSRTQIDRILDPAAPKLRTGEKCLN